MFPVLPDRIDVAQIHEHAVFDGLGAGVGVFRITFFQGVIIMINSAFVTMVPAESGGA